MQQQAVPWSNFWLLQYRDSTQNPTPAGRGDHSWCSR